MDFAVEKYLRTVRKLETRRHTLAWTMDDLDVRIKRLAVPQEISYDVTYPDEPDFGVVILFGLIPAITDLVCVPMLLSVLDTPRLVGELAPWVILATTIIVGLLIWYFSKKRAYEKECEACMKIADQDFERRKEQEKQRIAREKEVKKKYKLAWEEIQQQYDELCDVLEELYSYGIIYEKYQWDISAICMFYEYIHSGRCRSLKGHGGAYDVYEYELKLGRIEAKLDRVLEKLDEIADNQYCLYETMNAINKKQAQLVCDLDRIASNQKALLAEAKYTSYNSAVAAYNTEVIKYYNLFR